ncbi:ATP-dependent nuclease [Gardnerella greenwoodii]|uniref:Chromosome segregation protein SMC n=1 Tax=Gardnerella greenwoodii TaxID=2914925 RepID=A0A2N6RX89_9BIFI|nr:AAA family ATPase [Gardnerella greenwoodii]MDF0753714.1 ATP-binding protein [Gardnerella greenwoodii]PMC42736.1 chromosome segregation protein SMC [Gardnerella greenwoodii]
MYISKIILNNFKSFAGKHVLKLSDGINFFVGNNNCGKTTIFRAIEFIQSGKSKEEYITKGKESEDVSVEIEFTGTDVEKLVNSDNYGLKKYQDYLIKENHDKENCSDETCSIRILRSSESTSIVQGKKTVNLDIKNIRVYNPNSSEDGIRRYENPTGIDKTIAALFDVQFVYSDLKNEEYQDFGKTKIIGKIINDLTKDFQREDDGNGNKTLWGKFKDAHREAFGDEGLQKILKDTECKVTKILDEQYGEGEVKFNFELPEIDSFFKNGVVLVSDNGISTPVCQKGTGMQRALALSLIQLYAEINNKSEDSVEKPVIFCIDEPETFLHPNAQNNLMKSFNKLSQKSQILITTHSPYLLKAFYEVNRNTDNKPSLKNKLNIFSKEEGSNKERYSVFNKKEMLNISGEYSPTWGEINYCAFGMASVEYHIELFDSLHKNATEKKSVSKSISGFDKWLIEQEPENSTDDDHFNSREKEYCKRDKSMSTYIRNYIDHPGDLTNVNVKKIGCEECNKITTQNNVKRIKPSEEDIKKSIEFMTKIYKNNFCKSDKDA